MMRGARVNKKAPQPPSSASRRSRTAVYCSTRESPRARCARWGLTRAAPRTCGRRRAPSNCDRGLWAVRRAPHRVILSCADGNLGVQKLRWLDWGAAAAIGLGETYVNDCTPSCAGGKFHEYTGLLLATGTTRCRGSVTYGQLTVAIVRKPFASAPPLWLRTLVDASYPVSCQP
jgi:hypothetical protein